MKEATLERLRDWFERHQDRPRVIAIMSPTCGFCLIGHQAVKTYNAWLEGEDFATLRVWIPMMANDDEAAADQCARRADERITDMYDAHHLIGRAYRDVLGLAAAAWDTYMIYDAGTTWEGPLPPMPAVHQYQLYPGYAPDQGRLFTPTAFWWEVVERVGRSRDAYDAEVPPLTAWLNQDPGARIGLPVPGRYEEVA